MPDLAPAAWIDASTAGLISDTVANQRATPTLVAARNPTLVGTDSNEPSDTAPVAVGYECECGMPCGPQGCDGGCTQMEVDEVPVVVAASAATNDDVEDWWAGFHSCPNGCGCNPVNGWCEYHER